jgi:hypothetical protein
MRLPSRSIPRICAQGQKEKATTEDILSLGHPGHRFDMQRVQAKEGGYKSTTPGRGGDSAQSKEQQQCVNYVNDNVNAMVPAGI